MIGLKDLLLEEFLSAVTFEIWLIELNLFGKWLESWDLVWDLPITHCCSVHTSLMTTCYVTVGQFQALLTYIGVCVDCMCRSREPTTGLDNCCWRCCAVDWSSNTETLLCYTPEARWSLGSVPLAANTNARNILLTVNVFTSTLTLHFCMLGHFSVHNRVGQRFSVRTSGWRKTKANIGSSETVCYWFVLVLCTWFTQQLSWLLCSCCCCWVKYVGV